MNDDVVTIEGSPVAQQVPGEHMNILARAVNVLAAPGALFRYIAEHPGWSWIVPALAAFAAVVVRGLASAQLDSAQTNAEMQRILATMPEETARQAAPMMAMASPEAVAVQFIVGSIISLLIAWVACSAMLHLLSMTMGNHRPYRAMFEAVVWAWVPFIFRDLAQAVYIAISDKLILFPGLSALVAQSPDRLTNAKDLLFVAASHVDVFVIWNVVLLALAMAAIAGFGKIRSVMLPILYWAIVVILSWVLGTLGSSFTGM
ncbi:MAG: YIP1 family protein [Chloroflexi bacterium]|nr:YIP1 family protein [Chloroflexota bacterium]MBU1748234.1 YIP1 family protein [Chloroflexota bacterium]MBU1877344.1 YIP1 family protein [Chloroflexota bacterium]